MRRLLVLSAVCVFAMTSGSLARVWHVEPDSTGDAPTIRAAIDSASTGDIVELADGTFTGSGNRQIEFLGKAITVKSASGGEKNRSCNVFFPRILRRLKIVD